MFEIINKNICDYWYINNFIDCGQCINDMSNEIPVIIPNQEVNIISQHYVEYLFNESAKNNNAIEEKEEIFDYRIKSSETVDYRISNKWKKNKRKTRKNNS